MCKITILFLYSIVLTQCKVFLHDAIFAHIIVYSMVRMARSDMPAGHSNVVSLAAGHSLL